MRNELVVADSVIITNESRTQTFVEGFDYQLIIIGNITSVQRLVQGNILDGQTVIADYEYRTTGTAKFSTFGSAVSASINILGFAQASIRYSMTDTNVREGELTSPVNDRREFEFRIDADHRAGNRWTVGGGYRYLRNDEDIAPSVLNDFRLRASASVFGSAQLKMSAGVTQVDQKTSVEDIDQVFATLGLSGRLWL